MSAYTGIGFSGKAAAGKSHLAMTVRALLERRGHTCTSLSFSGLIRDELAEANVVFPTRQGVLEHGNYQRSIDPHYWVKKMRGRVMFARRFGSIPIIDNIRFPAEFDEARDAGFLLVRVTASGIDRAHRLYQRGEDPLYAYSDDGAECALDQYTFHLWANGLGSSAAAQARLVVRAFEGPLVQLERAA